MVKVCLLRIERMLVKMLKQALYGKNTKKNSSL